ncbi:MAG TPA: TetR/AcrR family transcriptional regulator [Anaerolineae bacterium]|nr:TetR/AcrR family transcriptional regulator [Anaerolineae bacterium]
MMAVAIDESVPTENPESGMDETRQRILQAAAMVFAEKGYARATTRSLAAAAGVNEVTLFRHFGNTQNLFAAVMNQFGGPALSTAMEMELGGDYRKNLTMVGTRLLQLLLERKDALRLMLCEATHFPEVQAVMVQNPRRIRRMLAAYLQQQIEQGRVRPMHPEAMAQAFTGMLFSYAIVEGFFEDTLEPDLAIEDLVAQFVDIFVEGTVSRRE